MLILRTLVSGPAHGHQIGKHIQRTTNDFRRGELTCDGVLLDGLRPVLVGLLGGLAASAALGSLIRSILYETTPLDPGVYVGVAGLLLIVAVAAQLDPMRALRTE
jgi:hypothetical protein